MNRRPYCTHARLVSDPDDGRGCPSCEVEARFPDARYFGRAARIERRVHAVLRVFGVYLAVIIILAGIGLVTGAIERI